MSVRKRIGVVALSLVLGILALELGSWAGGSDIGFVTKAEAVVGRPLTPVSVAGVGRRTVRRCAAGVYNC
jgi:hypothetical protein